jgi:cellulose biosynthesis protein BcsQ
MAYKISIYNKKGGVGKTTIAVNLAALIAAKTNTSKRPVKLNGRVIGPGDPFYRVLLIDADQQENTSDYLGMGSNFRDDVDKDRHLGTVLMGGSIQEAVIPFTSRDYLRADATGPDVLSDEQWTGFDDNGQEVLQKRKFRFRVIKNFHIVPAHANLEKDKPSHNGNYSKVTKALDKAGLEELTLGDLMDEDLFRASLSPTLLAEKISEVEDQYDYIFIDCPPSWDRHSKMSILACDQIIIPLKPGEFERLGVIRVMDQLGDLQALYGKKPDLIFAIMNMMRGNVKKHTAYHIKNFRELGRLVAMTGIPLTEEVNNSQGDMVPFAFAPKKYPVMVKIFNNVFREIRKRFSELEAKKEAVRG